MKYILYKCFSLEWVYQIYCIKIRQHLKIAKKLGSALHFKAVFLINGFVMYACKLQQEAFSR